MGTPKTKKDCRYVLNDFHKCKIKLEKFHFDILCRFGVTKESLPGGKNPPPHGGKSLNETLPGLDLQFLLLIE